MDDFESMGEGYLWWWGGGITLRLTPEKTRGISTLKPPHFGELVVTKLANPNLISENEF
jgi:hypothetical protein